MNSVPELPQSHVSLTPGDPAPWFKQRATNNANFSFDTAAGRYIVLCFFGSASDALGQATIEGVLANRHHFDDTRVSFFGVSLDPLDESEPRVRESLPGIRFFWDFDGQVSRLYGAIPKHWTTIKEPLSARRFWIVLDPTLRVLKVIPLSADDGPTAVLDFLMRLPPPERFAGVELQAPILFLPNIFEREFCHQLISLYHSHGGQESGFMREIDGKTVRLQDQNFKRRKDFLIEAADVIRQTQARVVRRVVPEIRKVYAFKVTRMERYIIACYSAADAAHFKAHRDNMTKGTAHRRFAVSINLNDDFEGGEVSFPEYGPRRFKAPPGGAVVFPCRLLHAVSQVTSGERFAFLPFLYDDEAAKIRAANNKFLGDGISAYKHA